MISALQMTLINIRLQEENNNEKCGDVTLTRLGSSHMLFKLLEN